MKIKNYMEVDAQCKRVIDTASYGNREWFLRYFGTDCQNCGMCMCWEIVDNRVVSDLTADRLDNSKAHNLDNIQPLCRYCNCSKGNR